MEPSTISNYRHYIANSKRVVIKIGSGLLVHEHDDVIKMDFLNHIVDDIALWHHDKDIIIVSSGSKALGRRILNIPKTPDLASQQASAAAGQIALAQAWQHALQQRNIQAAQILLTPHDTEERKRHLNARATINALCRLKAIAIINENDSVATEELRYGDNDRLAARVAAMAEADLCIILSDIDGLYTKNPTLPDAVHIPYIDTIDDTIMAMASDTHNEQATGGMKTKLLAANIAMRAGCHLLIAHGNTPHPLQQLHQEQSLFTFFHANISHTQARKKWIQASLYPQGFIMVDDGAISALYQGKSLLGVGCTQLNGYFSRGDIIEIRNQHNQRIGMGLANHDSDICQHMLQLHSDAVNEKLQLNGRTELIHSDHLVLD